MDFSAGPGICGKRVGFDEIYGSSLSSICSATKRSRHSQWARESASSDADDPKRIPPNQEAMKSGYGNAVDGSNWVDIFVQEMTNSADLDDAKGRIARILEAFEISIRTHSTASQGLDLSSLRSHLHILLRENQILKRAVAIQHEHELEQAEKTVELKRLQHVASQFHGQVQKMELANYSLKIQLQQAQTNTITGQYLPDVY